MGKIRFFAALWAAKAARLAMRLLGRNATYLPGSIAIKLCPQFLGYVKKPGTRRRRHRHKREDDSVQYARGYPARQRLYPA